MRKALPLLPLLALGLSGCSASSKSGSLWAVYGIAVLISLLIFLWYACLKGKKDPWFFLLLGCVLVVNCGYLLLSRCQTLSQALWANRLSYLGSVGLPLSMLVIIADALRLSRPKWLTKLLIAIGLLVFFVAASPGILPIYYKEVSFLQVDGVGTLQKVYGPLHLLYYVYLFGYFGTMVYLIARATLRKDIHSPAYSLILAMAVFVNIGVWLVEQFVKLQFEILSLSYIISVLFLLGLRFLKAEMEKNIPAPSVQEEVPYPVDAEQQAIFQEGLASLTKKEHAIFQCYVDGLTTQQILEKLSIKENTLKFHNKNLYSKLGISSRKELVAIFCSLSRISN